MQSRSWFVSMVLLEAAGEGIKMGAAICRPGTGQRPV